MLHTEETLGDSITKGFNPSDERYILVHRTSFDDATNQWLKDVAEAWGYNLIEFRYNTLLFGAACDTIEICSAFVSPWLDISLENSFIPPPLKYKRSISEALKATMNLPIPVESDPVVAEYLKRLPNGWNSTYGEAYMGLPPAPFPMCRPSLGLALHSYMLNSGCCLLHPAKERFLTDEEFNAIMKHSFFDWLGSKLSALPVLEQPRYEQDLKFAFEDAKLPYMIIASNIFKAR